MESLKLKQLRCASQGLLPYEERYLQERSTSVVALALAQSWPLTEEYRASRRMIKLLSVVAKQNECLNRRQAARAEKRRIDGIRCAIVESKCIGAVTHVS